jgi:hypothetical protein
MIIPGPEPIIRLLSPNQSLFRDLNRQHQAIVMGACRQAIRSIEGREPSEKDLEKNFGRVVYEHGRFMEFVWKKNVIIRVHAPEPGRNGSGIYIQRRKIEQVWKKRPGSV